MMFMTLSNFHIMQLDNMMKQIKPMKSDIIYIYDNIAYGLDEENSRLTVIKVTGLEVYHGLCFNMKDMKSVIKNGIDNIQISSEYPDTLVSVDPKNNKVSEAHFKIDTINQHRPVFLQMINIYNNMNQNSMVYKLDNFHETTEYQEYYGLKASEGIVNLNIQGYPITIYNGVIPSNKSDKVDIEIHDINENMFGIKIIVRKSSKLIERIMCCFKI